MLNERHQFFGWTHYPLCFSVTLFMKPHRLFLGDVYFEWPLMSVSCFKVMAHLQLLILLHLFITLMYVALVIMTAIIKRDTVVEKQRNRIIICFMIGVSICNFYLWELLLVVLAYLRSISYICFYNIMYFCQLNLLLIWYYEKKIYPAHKQTESGPEIAFIISLNYRS